MTRLEYVREFLSDPAHWARGYGDYNETACIITAAWRTDAPLDTLERYHEFIRTAIREWQKAVGRFVEISPSIRMFNDRDCPDHATLMQVLDRAVELERDAA